MNRLILSLFLLLAASSALPAADQQLNTLVVRDTRPDGNYRLLAHYEVVGDTLVVFYQEPGFKKEAGEKFCAQIVEERKLVGVRSDELVIERVPGSHIVFQGIEPGSVAAEYFDAGDVIYVIKEAPEWATSLGAEEVRAVAGRPVLVDPIAAEQAQKAFAERDAAVAAAAPAAADATGGAGGLYWTGTRPYDPTTGRFLQPDPAKAGNNWYAYCEGDPVNREDPSGLDWVWISPSNTWEWDGHYGGEAMSEDEAFEAGLFPPDMDGDAPEAADMFPRDVWGRPVVGATYDSFLNARAMIAYAEQDGDAGFLLGAARQYGFAANPAMQAQAMAVAASGRPDRFMALEVANQYAAIQQLGHTASTIGDRVWKQNQETIAAMRRSRDLQQMAQEEGIISMAPDMLLIGEAVPGLVRGAAGLARFGLRAADGVVRTGVRAGGAFGRAWLEEPIGGTVFGMATGAVGPYIERAVVAAKAARQGLSYEATIRALYPSSTYAARTYRTFVGGQAVNGVADAIGMVAGEPAGVEAKFIRNWAKSIYNPASPVGVKSFAARVRNGVLAQARKYSAGYRNVIYHSNSPEFIQYWSKEFAANGITNIQFLLTP